MASVRSERSLRQSIKNRTKGLCKKAYELAVLCDVELALICYSSDAAEPTTWPPDRSKIEDTIRHYIDTPAHKKLPKNQIALDNPNPGADTKKEAGKAAEEADRLRIPFQDDVDSIPFPDDVDKLMALERILDSRLVAVREMIALRRTEGRRDPRPSAPDEAKQLAVAAASAVGGDPATSDRDRGNRVAGDFGPVGTSEHPGFSPPPAGGDGGAPNPSTGSDVRGEREGCLREFL